MLKPDNNTNPQRGYSYYYYASNPCIHLNKPAFTCECFVSLFLASMDALKCFSTIIAHFCAEPFSASFVIIFMQHEDKQDIIR